MMYEPIPRALPERTGRHLCARCLLEVPESEYYEFDHFCAKCAAEDTSFPLATTPEAPSKNEPR